MASKIDKYAKGIFIGSFVSVLSCNHVSIHSRKLLIKFLYLHNFLFIQALYNLESDNSTNHSEQFKEKLQFIISILILGDRQTRLSFIYAVKRNVSKLSRRQIKINDASLWRPLNQSQESRTPFISSLLQTKTDFKNIEIELWKWEN